MTTRYRNPDNHNDMVECPMGEYVRYEDYAKVCAALKPLADKWLYPDDIGDGFTDEDATDDSFEEVMLRRGWIRAARVALGEG
jgi:hypothetical protein